MKRNIFSHRPCFVLSFVLVLLLVVLCPPPPASAQPLGATLARYSEHFQQEKVHLHFDKAGYNKGETIWYKAYLMAGFDPSDYSRNLYIDWYDPTGKLLKHEAAPIFEASARGQFDIPAGYTGGFLHVRAYTKWMLNFDSAFLFNKNIPVVQTTAGSTLPHTASPEKGVSSLQFFPEGGDLVNGLLSRVAFKAVNSFGLPVKIRGVIRSGSGDLVDSLTTEHDGMGSFFLQPAEGEVYTGSWTDEYGNIYATPLPAAKNTGATLQVQPHAAKSLVVIQRSEPSPENLRTLNVIAHMNQSLIYQAAVNLSARSSAITEIPTDTLPTGVLQITLFDANWVPLAERVVFVNNNRHLFTVEVNTLERSPEKRGKNVIGLEIPDSSLSNLSVSVTDAGLATESNTIVSQLLLCGDIKGTIYHPSYYFSADNTRTALHLDLVMMTHGWRRFNWPDIVRGKDPILPYARDTDYLHLEGKFLSQGLKLLPDQKLMVVLQSKDSSRQRLLLPVRPDGSFSQSGVSFFDTLKVYYQLLGNKRAMEASALTMKDGLLATPKNAAPFQSGGPDTTGWWRSRYFAQEQEKLNRLTKGATLADVVVSAKVRRPVDLLDDKYATGLFKRPGDYQFDMINDPWAKSSINVFEFLKQMVPGLQVQFRDGIPVLNWRGGSPSLFLDETGMRAEMINDVPVADIAYVKVYRPPFYGAIGGGRGGAIAIYTRKGGDVEPVTAKGLDYKLLEGYTPYRQFYSPDYSQPVTGDLPDIRTTLYWNPLILTEPATHSVKLEFYNNDTSKRLRIVVEGMNAAGKLCRVEKVIEGQ